MGVFGPFEQEGIFFFRFEGNDCIRVRHVSGCSLFGCIGFNILAGFGGGRNVPFFLFWIFFARRPSLRNAIKSETQMQMQIWGFVSR